MRRLIGGRRRGGGRFRGRKVLWRHAALGWARRMEKDDTMDGRPKAEAERRATVAGGSRKLWLQGDVLLCRRPAVGVKNAHSTRTVRPRDR